jgi:hypothetical protein
MTRHAVWLVLLVAAACRSAPRADRADPSVRGPSSPGPASAPLPAPTARLSGVVAGPDQPLEGATVYLYEGARPDLGGPAGLVAGPTAASGEFSVVVEPGTWWLLARRGDPLEWFGFYGGNPLRLEADDRRTIVLGMARQRAPDADLGPPVPSWGAGLRGVVRDEEGAVPGADIQVFLSAEDIPARQPVGRVSADPRGRFRLSLPPGRYFLVATARADRNATGPLAVGDRYCFHGANPISLAPDTWRDVALACARRPATAPTIAANRILVSGTVLDEAGAPAPGLLIGAYLDASLSGQPSASAPSRDGGRFELELPREGTYHLIARSTLSGPPLSGQLLGAPEDGAGLLVNAGQRIQALVIVVRPVP